jgi:hypothetical protein
MASGYTIFTTYVFVPTTGNSEAIHCNYIKSLQLNPNGIDVQEVSMNFPNINDFKFLSSSVSSGTGYTANSIYAVIQLINNSGYTNISDVKPDIAKWKYVDLTSQIPSYAGVITPANITSVVFKIPLSGYSSLASYNLNYLNYPISGSTSLCFGDEIYFLGNVTTDIHADVYVANINIPMVLGQFNSTTNPTWDSVSSVYATEVGIYDSNGNLVAIGKFNDPVEKNSNIARTIEFAIDF